jgi:hypothetical protein
VAALHPIISVTVRYWRLDSGLSSSFSFANMSEIRELVVEPPGIRRCNQRLHLPILTFAWLSVRQHRSKNEVRIRKAKLNIFVFRKD